MHDVIVIGGGPTGSHVARRLAENNYDVLVLEKNAAAGQKFCCTGIVGLECVNAFDIDKKVILKKVNSATLWAPSGKSIHVYRPEPQAAILDRPAFDISMAERAEKAGAAYRFNSHVSGISVEKDRVIVSTENSQIPARAVVIASGFNPGLNEKTGLGKSGYFAAGVQADVATDAAEVEVYFGNIAPGFFGWLVPTLRGAGRAGLLSHRDAGPLLKKWLQQLVEQGKIKSAEVMIHYGGVPLKPPPQTYGERVVAIGDAAGQVKPITGGGIYYGLIGAEIAADILNQALKDNDLAAKRLSTYERAWRRKLGGELRTSYWARRCFEKLNERQIDGLFSIVKSCGIDDALLKAKDISFDWHSRTMKSVFKYQMIGRFFKKN